MGAHLTIQEISPVDGHWLVALFGSIVLLTAIACIEKGALVWLTVRRGDRDGRARQLIADYNDVSHLPEEVQDKICQLLLVKPYSLRHLTSDIDRWAVMHTRARAVNIRLNELDSARWKKTGRLGLNLAFMAFFTGLLMSSALSAFGVYGGSFVLTVWICWLGIALQEGGD